MSLGWCPANNAFQRNFKKSVFVGEGIRDVRNIKISTFKVIVSFYISENSLFYRVTPSFLASAFMLIMMALNGKQYNSKVTACVPELDSLPK